MSDTRRFNESDRENSGFGKRNLNKRKFKKHQGRQSKWERGGYPDHDKPKKHNPHDWKNADEDFV